MRTPFFLLLGLTALAPVRAFDLTHGDQYTGDKSGDARVDVIVELTDAGKKIERPTPDHPVYYLPIPSGYKESGGYLKFWQRPPPPVPVAMKTLTKALAEQGYLIMTHEHHPSLVLIVWWGYMAPQTIGPDVAEGSPVPFVKMTNAADMLALTWGERFKFTRDVDISDLRLQSRLLLAAQVPRYYLTVSAVDFQDWLHHKNTLLWRAHVSAPYWTHYLDETLPALIKAGAPMFGRDMTLPKLIDAPIVPLGRVEIGTPVVVKDHQPPTPTPAPEPATIPASP